MPPDCRTSSPTSFSLHLPICPLPTTPKVTCEPLHVNLESDPFDQHQPPASIPLAGQNLKNWVELLFTLSPPPDDAYPLVTVKIADRMTFPMLLDQEWSSLFFSQEE